MKRALYVSILIVAFFVWTESGFAQLRKDIAKPNISGVLTNPGADFLFGLLDPSKIHMRHSFAMSYGSFGSGGLMLSSYLNTIDYQITEKLFLRTNLGIMTSPYNTYGENFFLNKPQFFGGAQLDYKINNNTSLQLRFDSAPYYYYRPSLGQFGYEPLNR